MYFKEKVNSFFMMKSKNFPKKAVFGGKRGEKWETRGDSICTFSTSEGVVGTDQGGRRPSKGRYSTMRNTDPGREENSPLEDDNAFSAFEVGTEPGRVRERQIVVTPAHREALKARKASARISDSDQIRLALEAYLEREPQIRDRAFLNSGAGAHRKLVPIADSLWDELRARKDRTGLDLDEQVQIALALYFRSHSPEAGGQRGENSALQIPGIRRASELLSAPRDSSLLESGLRSPASGPDPLLVAARIMLSNAALEATQGSGSVALVSLPSVPCGPWREAIHEGTLLSLPRELAEILGAHTGDLLVPTDGQSMVEAGIPDGGRVVMRPLNGRHPQIGEIVLCCIERQDGMWESTIKFWFETPRGAPLLKNGKLQEIHLPADLVEVHPVATLVGVMGRATFGTHKGLPTEARDRRHKSHPTEDPLAE
ncbi:hypothetical protein IAD21_00530 [Abditibacteriota bacterium]|nr:hypothetical protein IAD21_00530 [Abditibacteriota bacterium]